MGPTKHNNDSRLNIFICIQYGKIHGKDTWIPQEHRYKSFKIRKPVQVLRTVKILRKFKKPFVTSLSMEKVVVASSLLFSSRYITILLYESE